MTKRMEIYLEFLYYLIDSVLIPLVRSNFYVTESNNHRNRLFFFRHDVWRYVAEPAMASLKSRLFEEVKIDEAEQILSNRFLGLSHIRLLPKKESIRPIMNLRRRAIDARKLDPKKNDPRISKRPHQQKPDQKMLGQSINTILRPIHKVLSLEKVIPETQVGSGL